MTRATYDNLIANTEFAGIDNRNGTPVITVRPRNANEAEWLNRRLATAITPVLLEYCQQPVAFRAALEEELA
jgi:siderophore synthetase component